MQLTTKIWRMSLAADQELNATSLYNTMGLFLYSYMKCVNAL